MKILSFIVTIFFLSSSIVQSSVVDELEKLSNLHKEGRINNEQFEKAKEIILKIDEKKKKEAKEKKETPKKSKEEKSKIIIRQFKEQVAVSEKFEKMEMLVGDFRIYTHRPGGMKIKRISDGKQLAVYGDSMRMKYYNNSEDFFKTEMINDDRMLLKLNDIPILLTDKRFVPKHQASFYQILALGSEPFHYYIKLPNKSPIALNYKKFEKKIAKAVEEAKVRLASTHNVTIDQINLLMKKREQKAMAEIEKIVGEKREEVLQAAIDSSLEGFLEQQLEEAIGSALANEFVSAIEAQTGAAIDQAIEDELAQAIDEVVAAAISEGISKAAIEAGIQAYLDALASGASEEDAYAAGEAACGC